MQTHRQAANQIATKMEELIQDSKQMLTALERARNTKVEIFS